MILNLIIIGLVLICFTIKLGLFFIFPNLQLLLPREAKEFISLVFAGGIILYGLHKDGIKPVQNKLILLLVVFLTFQRFLAPQYSITVMNQDIGGFWQYKPILEVWIYFLMGAVIAGCDFTKEEINKFLKTIFWIAIVTSGYAIAQWLNQDNTMVINNMAITAGKISTTFTTPNLTGLFLALALPIAFYFKKYWAIILISFAIYLCQSQVDFLVAGFCVLTYMFFSLSRKAKIFFSVISVLISGVFLAIIKYFDLWSVILQDSGRFHTWKMLIDDIFHKPIIEQAGILLTGYSFGSFGVLFPAYHNSIFFRADNEYLELLFQTGIGGPILLILSICSIVFFAMKFFKCEQNFLLLSMFLGLCLAACFTFPWQVQPFRYLTIIIIGILLKKLNQTERAT